MDIPEEIQDFCSAFLSGLKQILTDKLYGVYLYGAWAFPEGTARGDIDFHVILKATLNDKEKLALRDLHTTLEQAYPSLAGNGLDGYYLLLEDAQQTACPRHQILDGVLDNSWALHRAHIRAGRCLVLYGPDPREVYPEASWMELDNALQGELDYVTEKLTVYPAYCVLNLCRLMYSFNKKEVVISKYASAQWACANFPEKCEFIMIACKNYEGLSTIDEKELLEDGLKDFYDFACVEITKSRGKD